MSADQEAPIRQRLAQLSLIRRETNIEKLITQMNEAPLSDADRAEFNIWARIINFRQLGSSRPRALAIAVLFARVIRPALVRNPNAQGQAGQWEQLSHNILRGMLPPEENVESFLSNGATRLMVEQLLQRQEVMDAGVAEIEREELERAARSLHTQIDEVCARLREGLRVLNASQRENLGTVQEAREELARGVVRARQLIASQETMITLQADDRAALARTRAILDEYEALIGRIA
jgi:hypothetical protein